MWKRKMRKKWKMPPKMKVMIDAILPTGARMIGELVIRDGSAFVRIPDDHAGEMLYAIDRVEKWLGVYGVGSIFLGEKAK